jgi:hypothetical protein
MLLTAPIDCAEIIDAQVEFSIQGPGSDNPESEPDSDEGSVEPMQPCMC